MTAWEEVNRDLWAVLNRTTEEGAARRNVESTRMGEGMQAY